MRRKKTKGVLKSGKIYSAQAYLELVLGECYNRCCRRLKEHFTLTADRMAALNSKKRKRRFHIREIMCL